MRGARRAGGERQGGHARTQDCTVPPSLPPAVAAFAPPQHNRTLPRCLPDMRGQAPSSKALRAAATASSTSSLSASAGKGG